jgi:hypothetical protein
MPSHGKRRRDADDPKWQIEIDLYIDYENAQPPFWLDTCLQVNAENEIIFHNRGRHGFLITYYLHDQTDRGYVFLNSKRDVLWSWGEAGCPPEDYGQQWREFKAQSVTDDTLVVRNLNETPTHFGYTLRVQDADGNIRNLDPGGDNQNGFFLSYY